jgi:hypothetical protein
MTRSVFYPRCGALLSVVFDGHGAPNSKPLVVEARPKTCSVNRNGYHEADTWSAEFDARALPFDPDLIASLAIRIYMWDAGTKGEDNWAVEDNEMVRGLADEPELEYSSGQGVFRASGRDYTGVLDPQWDPKKKLPAGKPLDETVQLMADLAAPAGTSARFTVDWQSNRPKPIVGAAQRSTKRKGLWVKPGTTYWDLIYSTVLNHGFIAYVRESTIVITDARTQTKASLAKAVQLAHGRDLMSLKVARNLAREQVPQIRIRTIDPKTKKRIDVVYPDKRNKPKTAIGTTKDEYLDLPSPNGIVDRDTMLEFAKMRFDFMGRAEATYSFTTRHLSVEDSTGSEADMLRLQAGDPVAIKFDAFNAELWRQLESGERIEHLLNLGYSNSIAAFIANNSERITQFRQPYYTRQVSYEWSNDDGLGISVEAVNYVSESREKAAAP